MATVTLSVPVELKKEMDALSHVKWSAVLRDIISKRAKQLIQFEESIKRGEL